MFKAIVLMVGLASFGHAAGAGLPRGMPPVILTTMVDFQRNIMVISGHNFGSVPPSIRLADQVLKVKSFSANQVVVSLPADIQPATYGLTVTTSGAYRSTSARFSAALFTSTR